MLHGLMLYLKDNYSLFILWAHLYLNMKFYISQIKVRYFKLLYKLILCCNRDVTKVCPISAVIISVLP